MSGISKCKRTLMPKGRARSESAFGLILAQWHLQLLVPPLTTPPTLEDNETRDTDDAHRCNEPVNYCICFPVG